jgi:hypothetical protein
MYYNQANPDPDFKGGNGFTPDGDRIAERPADKMGQEFYHIFGRYLNDCMPDPSNMTKIATNAFALRLDLAKRYNTFFAEQVAPKGKALWKDRLEGKDSAHAWSFGIKGHARAGLLYNWLDDKYSVIPSKQHTLPEPVPVPLVELNESTNMQGWKVTPYGRILKYNKAAFLIDHGPGHSVPKEVSQATRHWQGALNPDNDLTKRMQHIACLEWRWYWTNPFGRAGALTGDILSLSLQKRLQAEGHNIHMRDRFYSQDLEAYCYDLPQYVCKRMHDFKLGAQEKSQDYQVTLLDKMGGVRPINSVIAI